MSNMHTLIHDNTFVIIQEIRAFHKNSLARAYGTKKTAPPGSMFIDPGGAAHHSVSFFCFFRSIGSFSCLVLFETFFCRPIILIDIRHANF